MLYTCVMAIIANLFGFLWGGQMYNVFNCNHHSAEISVIWLVEQDCYLIVNFACYEGETNFVVQKNFSANTYIDSIFWCCKKKTMQWSYDNRLRSAVATLLKRDAFRPYWKWSKLMIC